LATAKKEAGTVLLLPMSVCPSGSLSLTLQIVKKIIKKLPEKNNTVNQAHKVKTEKFIFM